MRDYYHMSNSKACASFVLLFSFLVFSHAESFYGNDFGPPPPWYNGGVDYKPPDMKDIGIHDSDFRPPSYAVDYQPSSMKDIGIHDNDFGPPPPWYNGAVDYQPSNLKDIGNYDVHRHGEFQEVLLPSTDDEIFHSRTIEIQRPFSSMKLSRLEPERDQHTHAIDYQPPRLKDYEAVPPEWLPPRSESTDDEILHNHFIEIQRPFSSMKPSRQRDHHTDAIDYHPPGLKDIATHRHDEFQPVVPLWGAKSDHFTNVINYQPLDVKDIERKNCMDGTETMSHRKMVKPREENNDLRSFHASPVKI